MVYIYVLAAYYYLNLDVTKENLLAAGFSAVPAVFLVRFVLGHSRTHGMLGVEFTHKISQFRCLIYVCYLILSPLGMHYRCRGK